jgi:hypothetical protein
MNNRFLVCGLWFLVETMNDNRAEGPTTNQKPETKNHLIRHGPIRN